MSTIRKILAAAVVTLPIAALAAQGFVPLPGAPGELTGQVTRKDGTPVTAFNVNGMRFNDADGRFKILVPPEGSFRVVIRAAGFAPNFIQVEGAAGKKLNLPEVVLGQGEKFIGEVVDAETGMPVPGASVSLADPAKIERLRFVRPERLADVTKTGIGGYYLLAKAPRANLLLVVRHPDYLPEFLPVNTRGNAPAVTLHKPAALKGVIRDASGALAAGVRVVALSEQVYDGGETKTDSFGRWALTGLRPGPYKVHALGATASAAGSAIELRDGQTTTVALELGREGSAGQLRGGMYAQAPAPVAP